MGQRLFLGMRDACDVKQEKKNYNWSGKGRPDEGSTHGGGYIGKPVDPFEEVIGMTGAIP